MYDTRDDVLVRPTAVLTHFKRRMEHEVRERLIAEFKKAWDKPNNLKDPSEFKVEIWFDQIYQSDIVEFIGRELAEHGWKNYVMHVRDCPTNERKVHVLECRLEANDAAKYSRP